MTKFVVDNKRFNKVLMRYLEVTGKSWADEVNRRAFNICLKASSKKLNYTKAATDSRIRKDLMKGAKVQPPPRKKRKKGGGRGRRKKAPIGAILINYARGKRGEPGLQGKAMKAQLQKNIESRQRGKGFMRAGWIGAADDIRPYLKKSKPKPKGQRNFSVKGYAIHARYGALKPWAKIVNGVPWSDSVPAAVIGLKKAVRAETKDMIVYLKRKVRKDWEKTNKRR